MIITSIKAFLQLETDFSIHGFTDPEQAAAFAQSDRVDVVVSDYLMPKLNGIQLLTRVKESQPEASRVLLTGHADKQSAIDAINQVSLFQYLEKPWDNSATLAGGAKRRRARASLSRSARESQSAGFRAFQPEDGTKTADRSVPLKRPPGPRPSIKIGI